MHARGGGRGLKTGRFCCLQVDGRAYKCWGGGELNNRTFTVIKFFFKIFKILSRFGSDSFWNSEMANSHRHPRRDPFNQNSNRSDREKWSTSKGGTVFSKLFRLNRTDPLSFGPKFLEILVEWISPLIANPSLCVDSAINRSLFALAFYATLLNNCSLFTDPLFPLQSPSSAGDKI